MLPLVLASHIRAGIEDFLRTSFSMPGGTFAHLLEDFIANGSAFKGPYLSLGLPFCPVESSAPPRFPELDLPFAPYLHQELAYRRLAPQDGSLPYSTLVATGTGSGKTECFLYPVLEHCRQQRALGREGVKAILIYPMNALATDQAGRIARFIAQRPALAGLRVGLYVGGQEQDGGTRVMSAESVITHRDSMRGSPPDILLTNYKMLDFLLLRPEDRELWRFNGPETLRYLVVDELHTFDGAQGTDLACLIRRLKARLHTPAGGLCCVGTSATLGDDAASLEHLLRYASEIFGEDFDNEAVIREHRLSPAEFLGDGVLRYMEIPDPQDRPGLDVRHYPDPTAYLAAQYRLWFREPAPEELESLSARLDLGERLKGHVFFQNLVRNLRHEVQDTAVLADKVFPAVSDPAFRAELLDSLLSLVSVARRAPAQPLLHVRTQLWLRELTRMVASVENTPRLAFDSDMSGRQDRLYLPVVSCRECGAAAWLTATSITHGRFTTDLQKIYRLFFGAQAKGTQAYTLLFPHRSRKETFDGVRGLQAVACGCCGTISAHADEQGLCPACHADACVPVLLESSDAGTDCPFCKARNAWLIFGSRAASLTSAVISILFGSPCNDDKKLITFSDNVQDAAHRAGFFGARTFVATLRTAMAQALHACGDDMPLADFPQAFSTYWRQRLSLPAYIATFCHPDMEWMADYEHLRTDGRLPAHSSFPADVDNRLAWEILGAHTFNGGIGRTPERTGCAIAHVPVKALHEAAEKLQLILSNLDDRLRQCTVAQCRTFLAGLFTRMRRNGAAFLHPLIETLLRNKGNLYALRKIPYMPDFGPRHKSPCFFSAGKIEHCEPLWSNAGTTWCVKWTLKVFPSLLGLGELCAHNVLAKTVDLLCAEGLMRPFALDDDRSVWGLARNSLFLSSRVRFVRCDQCQQEIPVAEDEADCWLGAPCLRHCKGHYQPAPERTNFYGDLYRHGDVARLFTAEHTGLLQRDVREAVEISFKRREKDRKPWDCNLLSCTPTLEMGIDIGDLSTTIQCSVPPAQANYLQRIGRAGRTDGNALNITIAGAKVHDLYFYADPLLMMRGHVATPGVFLNASAVLERQLTAYCMDRWVDSGIRPQQDLPTRLGKVLNTVEHSREPGNKHLSAFPYNFLAYIENHATEIFDGFTAMFGPIMLDETRAHLHTFLFGKHEAQEEQTPLGYKIISRLGVTLAERQSLRSRAQKARKRARDLSASPAQDDATREEIRQLHGEADALAAIVRQIQDRPLLGFFTDEGLMPNYAFPEQGVTLHSIIYRKRAEKDDSAAGYDIQTYEYQRAAQSALTEFAPGSTFYAEKRKIVINQVDIETARPQLWRLCPACSYATIHSPQMPDQACPRCGCQHFMEISQVREMLKLTQVFASTSAQKSRLLDEAESREPRFFLRQLLIDYSPEDLGDAFKLDTEESVFGYAHIKKATFREINFGEQGDTEGIMVAGVSMPRRGFRICAHCGSVLPKNSRPQDHAWGCPSHKAGAAEKVLDCVYLYRDFTSEAIKILLPFTGESFSQGNVASFIAAFALGMKLRFGGALSHLHCTLHTEPENGDPLLRKQFLVIYDAVPGGTGYLKYLMRDNAIFEIFAMALRHLEACTCADTPSHDGCYLCLLAYHNSGQAISKHAAMESLRELLRLKDTLVRTDTFETISASGLFESELEKHFIEALRRSNRPERKVTLTRQIINGREGFFLEAGNSRWTIEQQVDLGPEQGVIVPSRADFLLRPSRSDSRIKPIAVYTDGFTWHKERTARDCSQRMALVLSGKYLVWSLTWEDIETVFGGTAQDNGPDMLECGWLSPQSDTLWNRLGLAPHDRIEASADSFALLLDLLVNADADKWKKLADAYASCAAIGKADAHFRQQIDSLYPAAVRDTFLPVQPAAARHVITDSHALTATLTVQGTNYVPALLLRLCDDQPQRDRESFRQAWRAWLRACNIFQFTQHFCALTSTACQEGLFDDVAPAAPGRQSVEIQAEQQAWQACLDLIADERFYPVLDELMRAACPIPEVGYEITDNTGVAGEMELAWPDKKIGIVTETYASLTASAASLGWDILSITALDTNILRQKLG